MTVHDPQSVGEAIASQERIRDTGEWLARQGVKYVLCCWIDLLGQPKTKPVPLSSWERLCTGRGPQFAVHSVSFVPELGPADPDQIMVPDIDSLVICPWDRTCAWVFADLWWSDKPYNLCPRGAMKRILRDCEARGYRIYTGVEPEFIAMRWKDGQPVKAVDDDPLPGEGLRPRRQAFGYDVEFSIDSLGFLGELIDIVDGELDWDLHDVVAEGAYSQFELDFGYTDALSMADRLVFLRVLLKEIAKKHGMFVTFMPKPTVGDWRSGAHINASMRSVAAPDGNLFEGPDGGWSDHVRHAVAGLLRHGGALTAIACPTVNSYNGLVDRVGALEGGTVTWAPTHMTYGYNNRSAMLRLPQNRFCIENRAADMCMNPYLSIGVTAACMTEGVVNGPRPRPPPQSRPLQHRRGGTGRVRGAAPAAQPAGGDRNPAGRRFRQGDDRRADARVLPGLQGRRMATLSPGRHGLGSRGISEALLMARDMETFPLGDVVLQSGEALRDARLAYRTWGALNEAGDNAVLLPTFYTGTHTRNEAYFGRGRAIDPARHFVVSINLLGNGLSTSPSNASAPQDGPRLPAATFHDNVACQRRLLTERLGVRRLALVTGWSMGGCQTFQWGAQFPGMVDAILPFCGSARTAPHNVVFLEGVKAALCADGDFNAGDYAGPPVRGLRAFARVYAGWAYSQTWYREGLYRELGHATFEDVLRDWEADHVDNWDANDLLYMLETWRRGDISANDVHRGDLPRALGAIAARAIVMPCSSDLYFPPEDNAIEVGHMPNAELRVFETHWGHCAASGLSVPAFHAFFDKAAGDLLNG